MISYEVTKAEPKGKFIQVKYSKDGELDYYKNFRTTDFSTDNIMQLVSSGQVEAQNHWNATNSLPDSVDISGLSGSLKTIITTPQPQFDDTTETLEQTVVETDDSITYGWSIRPKTQAELDFDLGVFRATASTSMRQARLALARQGLLATVQSNINALSEESQIEWEYAGSVERNSPLVQSLGAALGLTDEQLDDLFKLAVTL